MFYLIDKPKGISSFKAIKQFAFKNKIKKIGHSGTLDPLATGALLVATNDDTRLLEYIEDQTKTYEVEFQTGYTSNTFDVEGEVIKKSDKLIDFFVLKKIIKKFEGKSKQRPPIFSAKKIKGQRAYNLARKNLRVKLKKISINILKITNIKKINDNTYSFIVKVSKGTYIRSLINDIGKKIKVGAVMTNLRRTEISGIKLIKQNQVIKSLQLFSMKKINIEKLTELKFGKSVEINKEDGKYLLILKKEIVGVGNVKNKLLVSEKLFGNKLNEL